MNEALGERKILCISQFTLYGETRRGNRPSFIAAARPEQAEPLYERFCERAGARRGIFGAHMVVELVNDGPVTLFGARFDRHATTSATALTPAAASSVTHVTATAGTFDRVHRGYDW